MSFVKRPFFWVGLTLRLCLAPFLLQWFHPDERQILEFAHFHAHGSLLPFMESTLHLRNQTVPWLFHWAILGLDQLGLNHPWIYLSFFHGIVGVWNWFGFCVLVQYFGETHTKKQTDLLGWFFALFWGFSFLYSRGLLESLSFAPTCFLFFSIHRQKSVWVGFWAGVVTVLRYPSSLFVMGALLAWHWLYKIKSKDFIAALVSFSLVLFLGGVSDWITYRHFFESAPTYLSFNWPNGPVQKMFGNDSLGVYLKWFTFLFTPWVAPLFIIFGAYTLACNPILLCFTLPYILGHLWTPHREPRFMLPLTPFLVLAMAVKWDFKYFEGLRPVLKKIMLLLVYFHIGLNFVWFPLNIWAQWQSGQGKIIRNFSVIAQKPTDLYDFSDPLIDALVPKNTRWADSECHWKRPPQLSQRVWVLSPSKPPNCIHAVDEIFPPFESKTLARLLRVRVAELWECPHSVIALLCPKG